VRFLVDLEGLDPWQRHEVVKHFGVDTVDALCGLMEMVADWVERNMGQKSRYELVRVSIVPVIFEQRQWNDRERAVRVKVVAGRVRPCAGNEARMWLALYPDIKKTFVHEVVHLVKPGAPESFARQAVRDLKMAARWEKSELREARSGH
jgi:hypothetical protein